MDTLYIGDIPSNYHYATFGNDYITLYNVPSAHNQTVHYYRVYDYDFGFYYTEGDQVIGQNYTYYQDINVSDNWLYRSDINKIFLVLFCIFVMFLFTFNIITSCVKKEVYLVACSKIKKILFILLCLFVLLFPFWCVRGLCYDTEEVDISYIDNLNTTGTQNYFSSSTSSEVGYFYVEKNYYYFITNNSSMGTLRVVKTSAVPALNGTYETIVALGPGESYSLIANDTDIIVCAMANGNKNRTYTVTMQKIEGQESAVNDLVRYVGIQSLWNTFNDANPFILVVVLFSFGLFIIIALVRKLRKGKGGI